MKYCPECGAALKDNAVYCTNCGARINPRKAVRIPQERIEKTPQKQKKTFKFDDDTRIIYPRSEQDYIRELKEETDASKKEKKPKKRPTPPPAALDEENNRSLAPFVLVALLISLIVAISAAFFIPYTITHHHAQVVTSQEKKQAKTADDYVIATSSSLELTNDDLDGLSRNQLHIAKNEIFARHGYIFSDSELADYFSKKDWYKTRIKQSDATTDQNKVYRRMSKVERENVAFIIRYGKSKGWSV